MSNKSKCRFINVLNGCCKVFSWATVPAYLRIIHELAQVYKTYMVRACESRDAKNHNFRGIAFVGHI